MFHWTRRSSALSSFWRSKASSLAFHRFRELVTAHPTLVFCRGEMLQEVMEQHQLTETEVLAAIRNHGHHSLEGIEFVIMEQDGSFSVIPRSATGAASAMADVPEFR